MSMTDRLVQRRVVSREDTSAVRGRGSGMLNTVCHNFAVSITVRRGGGGGVRAHTCRPVCGFSQRQCPQRSPILAFLHH